MKLAGNATTTITIITRCYGIKETTHFYGRRGHHEHIIAYNTHMAIIVAADSLKCKLLAGTLKEAVLRWYMDLLRYTIFS